MKVYQIYHNDKWVGYNNATSHKVEYVNRAYVIALYRNNIEVGMFNSKRQQIIVEDEILDGVIKIYIID